MKFALIDDWRQVFLKAWSIKFILLAGFFSGLEAVVQLALVFKALPSWLPPGVFALVAFVASNAAFVTRLIAQREIRNDSNK